MGRLGILLTVLFLLSGCSGGGSSAATLLGETASGQQPGPAAFAPGGATVFLRLQSNLPGAQVLPRLDVDAVRGQTAFYTLPGARIDVFGRTFALADQNGVAEFLSLPLGPSTFSVTSSTPGLVLASSAIVQSGRDIDVTVDEFTTMAVLLGVSASGDFEAIVRHFQNNGNSSFQTLRNMVEANLSGGQPWFFPVQGLQLELALQNALEAARVSETYITEELPYDGFVNYPTQPVYLGLVFSQAIDVSSLNLTGTGWSLQTPVGPIQAGNIDDYGSVRYLQQQETLSGRVFPANCLLFELSDVTGIEGQRAEFVLSLANLPRDLSGQPILSSRAPQSLAEWSFYVGGNTLPGAMVESNVTTEFFFGAQACDGGTTVADLSAFPSPPAFVLAYADPVKFSYQHYEFSSASPVERRLDLILQDADSMQVGDVYPIKTPDLFREAFLPELPQADEAVFQYTELTYPDGTPSLQGGWAAVSGQIVVTSLEAGQIIADFQNVEMRSALDPDDRFCVNGEVRTQFR